MFNNNSFNLVDKVALITGGRRGIGLAIAKSLATQGVHIAVVANSDNADEIKKFVLDKKRKFLYIKCDLTDRNSRIGLIKKVVDYFGKIDILVNNAGKQTFCPASEYKLEEWDNEIELMLTTVLDLSQQAYPCMKHEGGKIINIASISSFQGARNIIGYSTIKHALIGMTKCMSNEWAIDNININAIAPGIIETDMSKATTEDKEKSALLKSRIPSGNFGKPEDISGTAIFLCTDASKHINGSVITVDGGWLGR